MWPKKKRKEFFFSVVYIQMWERTKWNLRKQHPNPPPSIIFLVKSQLGFVGGGKKGPFPPPLPNTFFFEAVFCRNFNSSGESM